MTGAVNMEQDIAFLRESPFWYFLARRDLECSAQTLTRVIESLQHRAVELSLPIHYPMEHASAWATLLQLFEMAQPYQRVAGRFGYEMMHAGFDRVFVPKGFSKQVLSRLLGNLRSPAFPSRTRGQTVIDTFLANAMQLTEDRVTEALGRAEALGRRDVGSIMESCLTDDVMLSLGAEAVRPPEDLWETTVTEYLRRRPGFIRRQFSNVDSWLFE